MSFNSNPGTEKFYKRFTRKKVLRIITVLLSKYLYTRIYMQVALVCSVEAFPPATITWLQGGIQVRDMDRDMDMDRNKDRVRTMRRSRDRNRDRDMIRKKRK